MSTMSMLSLFSALGVKYQLTKNVRSLHKLGLGACRNLIVKSPRIIIASRQFTVSSVCLRRGRRDPRLDDAFDFGAGQVAEGALVSSSQSLPGRAGPSSNYPEAANFHRQIQRFHNSGDLLKFIDTCDSEQLDPASLEIVAKKLFQCVKNENFNSSEKKRVLASVGMQKLCRAVKKHCRNIFPEDLMDFCKLFVYLSAPGNHPTFQIVLRLLSKHANSLSLVNILFLNFLMNQMSEESKSPMSEAITLSLPMIFECQLNMQLDDTNLWQLVDCLQYGIKNNCSENILNKILDPIVEKQSQLNFKQAHSLLWSFSDCRLHLPKAGELLETSFKILSTNIHFLDLKQLNLLLSFCAMKSLNPALDHFYNEDFTEAACHHLVQAHPDADLELVFSCFKYITMLRHVNIDLIETIADLMASNPKAILHDDSAFYGIIKGLANASYKPEKWDALQPLLLEHPAVCKESSVQDVALTLDFLALDVLPVTLLHRIFSPDYFSTLERWMKKSGPLTLIMIYNAVKNLHPEYAGPMPPSSMVEHWKDSHRSKKEESKKHLYRLEGALQTALGGESYVMSGIVHEGIYIDHCVVMRQGGFPIAVQDRNPMNLEHIERPDNSFLILIKAYEREAYASNTQRLRGFHSLESKILAGFGHSVLEVDMWGFRKLNDSEKIPFLMRQIREHAGPTQSSHPY